MNVLVPAVVIFSLLSVLSGMATGLMSLLVIRAVMGVFEGPVASTGVAVAVEASHPRRDPVHLERLRLASLQRAKTLTWERCVTAYEHVMREAVRSRYARLHGVQTLPDRQQTGPLRVVPVQRVGALSER